MVTTVPITTQAEYRKIQINAGGWTVRFPVFTIRNTKLTGLRPPLHPLFASQTFFKAN